MEVWLHGNIVAAASKSLVRSQQLAGSVKGGVQATCKYWVQLAAAFCQGCCHTPAMAC